MRKDFANEVSRIHKIERTEMIEKDLIIHQILMDLSKNSFFSGNFIFKGGTCLIKNYLGYYRFSEDIDFTWKDQTVFVGKSQGKIRRYLSPIIDDVGKLLEEISVKRGLEFECEKDNKKFVELGGGNKFCTFKIWYRSEVLDHESFIKVQINFVEKLIFTPQNGELKSLLLEPKEELQALFPEYEEYWQKIPFGIYDIQEILTEKIRSILTRKGFKARDFLDVYLISKKQQIELKDMQDSIVNKTQFMLNRYTKYRKSFEAKKELLTSQPFKWGEEKDLLLQQIDEKDFFKFLQKLNPFLDSIIDEINQ